MVVATFITLAVAGTSLALGFTITTFADTGSIEHHHCQAMDCEECLLINPNDYPDCEICNPSKGNNNKLRPEIIGIIGAVTALLIGIPFVIFLAQNRGRNSKEILVKKEEY